MKKSRFLKIFSIRNSKSDIFEPSHFRTFEIHETDALKLINGPPQVTQQAHHCRTGRYTFRSSFCAALGDVPRQQGRDPSRNFPPTSRSRGEGFAPLLNGTASPQTFACWQLSYLPMVLQICYFILKVIFSLCLNSITYSKYGLKLILLLAV